jgi:hypothetical protein
MGLSRDELLSVPCPQCGAPAGERCRDGGRLRESPHIKRVGKAEAALNWTRPGRRPSAAVEKERNRAARYERRR